MRGSEGLVSHFILVDSDSGCIPAIRVEVVRSTGSHGGYRICDSRSKSPSELHYDSLRVGIPRFRDEVSEFVKVVVNQSPTLEVSDAL